jgi:hypothetical protein
MHVSEDQREAYKKLGDARRAEQAKVKKNYYKSHYREMPLINVSRE